MIKDYFLGGNTSKGFFSYYDYLSDSEKATVRYIIKGGPGTGKSSLMKKAGCWAEKCGFDVDYIHCSSDPDSLDGLVINRLGVAMVDGTAPHIVDPKYAGAVDVYVNLSEFWDEGEICKNKTDIIRCGKQISACFSTAYNYLAAAEKLHLNMEKYPDAEKERDIFFKIVGEVPQNSLCGKGHTRKMFLDAITPIGSISYADTLSYKNKIILNADFTSSAGILEKVKNYLLCGGYDIEVFYSPIMPDKIIRHIIVPELDFCVLTSDMSVVTNLYGGEIINLDSDSCGDECSFDFQKSHIFSGTMIQHAVASISKAKKLHDELEEYYIKNMDFSGVENKTKQIICQLEEIAHNMK